MKNFKWGLVVSTAMVLFIAVLILSFRNAIQSSESLPVYGEVAAFQLTDTSGQEVSLNHLRGKVWVADFIFTSCGGLCPTMTKNLAALSRSFELMPDVEMVSISVDPERDTPQVLSEYARGQNANLKKWHFLTGPKDDIQKLAVGSFKIGSVEDPVFHSDRFVLVDRKGRIRGYYVGVEKREINRLFKDIARLAKDKNR